MRSEIQEASIPADVMADLEEVCRLAVEGKRPSLELQRRISQRSAQAHQEMLDKFGVQEVGVAIIREMRDGR